MSDGWFLYVEPFAGASGDMLLGAMLGLGVPLQVVEQAIAPLQLPGVQLGYERVIKAGLAAHRAVVITAEEHHHRGLPEILALLERLPKGVSERAAQVFNRLAEAEARVHGIALDQVHFHEVGAADALVDVVGVAAALQHLGVRDVCCGAFPVGDGVVRCQHGLMPNPAPATLELLAGWPMRDAPCSAELVTPTGAAILTALGQPGRPPSPFTLETSAFGAGSRDFEFPNVLRASLGWGGQPQWETLVTLECHVDDVSGEVLGYAMERLFEEGALEVSFDPVVMKKSRPGHRLWLLCRPGQDERLTAVLMSETGTLGVRRAFVERKAARRDFVTVVTEFGDVRMKRRRDGGDGRWQASPEYEEARALARAAGVPLWRVYEAALLAFEGDSAGRTGDGANEADASGDRPG